VQRECWIVSRTNTLLGKHKKTSNSCGMYFIDIFICVDEDVESELIFFLRWPPPQFVLFLTADAAYCHRGHSSCGYWGFRVQLKGLQNRGTQRSENFLNSTSFQGKYQIPKVLYYYILLFAASYPTKMVIERAHP